MLYSAPTNKWDSEVRASLNLGARVARSSICLGSSGYILGYQ